MRRRANGTGTVYKLKGNRANPWIAKAPLPRDEQCRRRWVVLGYYKTKAEAEKALAINMVQPVSEKHHISFKELFDEWSPAHYERVGMQAKNLYNGAFALFSSIHKKTFCDIRTAQYQAIFDHCGKSKSYKNARKPFCRLCTSTL